MGVDIGAGGGRVCAIGIETTNQGLKSKAERTEIIKRASEQGAPVYCLHNGNTW
jgi:hypothetical protein